MGIRLPGFEGLAFASLDQHNFTSNTPFCILDIWQSLIRVVVLHLLSRGINLHSNKHRRNFTQDGLVSLRKVRTTLGRNKPVRLTSRIHAHVICFCQFSFFFNFQAELLAFVLPTSLTESIPMQEKHFQFSSGITIKHQRKIIRNPR